MPVIGKSYSLAGVILNIGGFDVTGYGPDGGIAFNAPNDLGEWTASADGKDGAWSMINDDSLEVVLTLMSTSRAYTFLAQQMTLQRAAQRQGLPTPPVSFYMLDPQNGDLVTDLYTFFKTNPVMTKESSISAVEMTMLLPNGRAQGNSIYGPGNII